MKLKSFFKTVFEPKRLVIILAGNLLVAFATVFFILPGNILGGGVTTVAILINALTGISRVTLIFLLNISLFVLGAICLGARFAASTILSTFLYPLLVSLLSMLDTAPFRQVDPLLCAFYAGLIAGAGLGLVFRVNASTGGMDIPALLMHKYLHMPTSTSVMIVDGITILCGLAIFGVNAILTGLICVMASSQAINFISTYGGESAQNLMIISENWEKIESELLERFERGVTILDGQGAWSAQKRPVLMCCVPKRDYGSILAAISAIDPEAFIIATSVHEVRGLGFTFERPDYENFARRSRREPSANPVPIQKALQNQAQTKVKEEPSA